MNIRSLSLTCVMAAAVAGAFTPAHAADKPRVVILATGGTIAGAGASVGHSFLGGYLAAPHAAGIAL